MADAKTLKQRLAEHSYPLLERARQFVTGDLPTADSSLDNPRAKYWTDKIKPIADDRTIKQPIEPVDTPNTPEVYKEPRKIYEKNIFITNIYNDGLPDRPSSLLPVERGEENLDQSPTKVSIGKPITLAQSISQQTFGQMMFNPFSTQKQVLRQARNESLVEELTELNEAAIDEFVAYKTGSAEAKVTSAVGLFAPLELKGLSGQMGVLFGFDTIKYFFSQLTLSSLNALIGVSDTIPNGYEVSYYNPQYSKFPDELTNVSLSGSGGGGDLALGSFFDRPIDWERWIEDAVRAQYGVNSDEYHYIKVDNLPDLIRNAIAPIWFRVGLRDLPFFLPKDLIQDPQPGDVEEQVQTKRLSEFFIWQIQAIDSVLGQFPVKIRIEDTDLIETGDQELKLEFPNLSELLTELFGLALANQTNNNALLKTNLIELAEIGQTKQQSAQNYYLLSAIQEYLGFKSKQIQKDIDFLFNPGILAEKPEKQTLAKTLQPSTQKMIVESNDDDDTLEKYMYTLIEAARIIKAKHFKGIDLRSNPAKQIADIIKQAGKVSDTLNADQSNSLEEFLKSVESGFANKISTKDPTKPHNRNYQQRPRVRHNIKDANNTQNNGTSQPNGSSQTNR